MINKIKPIYFLLFILLFAVGCKKKIECGIEGHQGKCPDRYTFTSDGQVLQEPNGICDLSEAESFKDRVDYYYMTLFDLSKSNDKRIIEGNSTKILFEEAISKIDIPFNSIKDKISFEASSQDGETTYEIINGNIIAPCFNDSDTVVVRLEWQIIKDQDKFHNSLVSNSSMSLVFINSGREHPKASCYSMPVIKSVTQPKSKKQICDVKIEIEGVTDEEFANSGIEISITDSISGFESKNYFKWDDVKQQIQSQGYIKNIWIRLKDKPETLRPYRNNGELYSSMCKPIDRAVINKRKQKIIQICNELFTTSDPDRRENLFYDNLLNFKELYILTGAVAELDESLFGKKSNQPEIISLFFQDFVFDFEGESVALRVKDVKFNSSGFVTKIIIESTK